MPTNSSWVFKCNLLCLLNLHIDIGTKYITNMKISSVIIGIRAETRQGINAVHYSGGMYLFTCLFMFDHRALFVYVKDRTCLRIAKPAYSFNISRSILCVLFCLLIRKLVLGSKTICQSMRKVPCAV